jgi:hypothetical protein
VTALGFLLLAALPPPQERDRPVFRISSRAARFANVASARKCAGMTGRAPIPPEEEIWRLARL